MMVVDFKWLEQVITLKGNDEFWWNVIIMIIADLPMEKVYDMLANIVYSGMHVI